MRKSRASASTSMSCNGMARSCVRHALENRLQNYSAIRVIRRASPTAFAAMATSCRSTYDSHRAAILRRRHLITDNACAKLERLVGELRPKLHRYCARMTGSAVDGEDIVQDSLIKALAAMPHVGVLDNPEGWLFRIAHNTALDFLRRRARGPILQNGEALDMIAAPDSPRSGPRDRRDKPAYFHAAPGAAAERGHPKGRAWPLAGGDRVDHWCERGRREVSSPTGARPIARVCQGTCGRLAADAFRWYARPADQVCRGVQDRRLRHSPRDAG